jgi:hypothetical protein
MEIHLVADTNLFFECKSLEQLPWLELGYDPVVILLTKPVLDEIDRHKKANGRTRTRALEIFGHVRNMLTLSVQDVEIQSSSPKVLLRRMPNVLPDPALGDHLDYTKTDERLVGIVATLQGRTSIHEVRLFTDDTGPATTADGLGIPYLMINESWRRPPSESAEKKKIQELEKDLANYRSQEPKISIRPYETTDQSNKITVTRKVSTPLTEVEIEKILATLRLKHPLVTDFTPPQPSKTTDLSGGVTTIEYAPPTEGEITKYRDVLYPQWIEECRKALKSLHEGLDEAESPIVLRWLMSNKGTRPALHVRIEFEAKGPLKLLRLPVNADDKGATADLSRPPATSKARFPSAPRPPTFRQQVTFVPPPASPKLTQRPSVASLKVAGLSSENSAVTALSNALARARLDSLSQRVTALTSVTEAVRLQQHRSLMFGNVGLDTSLNPSMLDTISRIKPFPAPLPYIGKLHDPEGFYYDDWSLTRHVKKGALTCDLWRHQTDEEFFEFEVVFTKEGAANGTVECTVHAENLTRPAQVTVIVIRRLEAVSVIELANSMIEACE